MRVLALNCGSSTLKFDVFDSEEPTGTAGIKRLAGGSVDRIGSGSTIEFAVGQKHAPRQEVALADHEAATRRMLDVLNSSDLGPKRIDAVGHRVVHGADRFVEPTLLDADVVDGIAALSELAPLHNGPALQAIRAARSELGAAVPMVAVFDTAFHRTLPAKASYYAIPRALAEKHRIRRYGFHGLAHRFMAERYAALTSITTRLRLVTMQLGNGCSITAVEGGRSLDTSMGFTPLEGLIMGTRSGDVDPSLAGFLARQEGVSVEEVEGWLNSRSGLLGVSGRSRDMRELLEAERQGDTRAGLAIEMFCYRARKYLGAYLAVLGGADAVVFGGGIGENAPAVRSRICAGMEWCGLILDTKRNDAAIGTEGRISTDSAAINAYVIPVNEAEIIVRDTLRCLEKETGVRRQE